VVHVPLHAAGEVAVKRALPALVLVAVALLVRVVPAALFGSEAADLGTYRDMATTVLRGDDVYARQVYFPYTPHSQFLPALAMLASRATGIRFDLAMRLESILADAATTWLLFAGLLWEGASRKRAFLLALSFALHPVAILVSAFHGNLMSLLAFLLLAALVAGRAAERAATSADAAALRASSALLLGLAIAMRSFPVLLLPVYLAICCRSGAAWRRAAVYTLLASAASVTSIAPYLVLDRAPFLREVLSYSGAGDFGWLAALRWAAVLRGGELAAAYTMLPATKPLFLAAYALALAAFFARGNAAARGLLLAPLLFYAVYGGVASQYLVWVVPVATYLGDAFLVPYTVAATSALVPFYWRNHPGILFGRLSGRWPLPILAGRILVWANVALVVVSWVWTLAILVAPTKRDAEARAPLPRWTLVAVAAGALAWAVFFAIVYRRVAASSL
jgi:hypothetical protein